MKLIGVYGGSGFGREVMPLLQDQYSNQAGTRCVFVDDSDAHTGINGYECMTFECFLSSPAEERFVTIAVANSRAREAIEAKCAGAGVRTINVRARESLILDAVQIGDGLIMCPFSMITSNVKIGRHFHANIYSYVAHDCVIGDFVTFAPGVKCNGNVRIEDHAYIGTGAILRQGKPGEPLVVGTGAVVGMGAVVTRNVPPGVTVVGNPARALVKD